MVLAEVTPPAPAAAEGAQTPPQGHDTTSSSHKEEGGWGELWGGVADRMTRAASGRVLTVTPAAQDGRRLLLPALPLPPS